MSDASGSRVTVADLAARKAAGTPIVMVTAYEYVSGCVVDAAGADIALVGDSAAMTVLGYPSTRQVSMDEMAMLAAAVCRGVSRALVIGDMPFGTYEAGDDVALANARRFLDAGCHGVKLEGAGATVGRARALVAAGIPVMGHVGLTPQRTGDGEGFRVQGKTAAEAEQLARDARALEEAGCFAIVFEAVPAAAADAIVPLLRVPVIGIGAGAAPDGQVLVFHDILGLYRGRAARFVRRYAELEPVMVDAVRRFADDVRARRYPAAEHTYGMAAEEVAALRERLGGIA